MSVSGGVRLPRERVRRFWRARIGGATLAQASSMVGVSESGGRGWVVESGGMIPDLSEPSGRYLSLQEREEIAIGWERGLTRVEIGRRLGRDRCTISREPQRNQTVRGLEPFSCHPRGTARPQPSAAAVSGGACPGSGRGTSPSAQVREAGGQPEAVWRGSAASGDDVESGADRGEPAP